jgi:hypothetical protein
MKSNILRDSQRLFVSSKSVGTWKEGCSEVKHGRVFLGYNV